MSHSKLFQQIRLILFHIIGHKSDLAFFCSSGAAHPGPGAGHPHGPPPPQPGGAPPQMPPPHQHPGAAAALPHLRRPGSFPGSGDPASVLSPRSSETGALGVNMAEYVLGGSPVGNRRMVNVSTNTDFDSVGFRNLSAFNPIIDRIL